MDRELVGLLARRATLAQRAGKAKAELGHPIVDPAREARPPRRAPRVGRVAHLDPEAIDELFRAILRFSRRAQRGEPRPAAEPGDEPGTG